MKCPNPSGPNGLTVEDTRKDPNEIMRKYGYTPDSPLAREYLEKIGKFVDESKLGAPVMGIGAAGTVARPVAAAADTAGALKRGAAKVGGAMIPKIAPETAALAQKAQAIGIPACARICCPKTNFLRLAGEWSGKCSTGWREAWGTASRFQQGARAVDRRGCQSRTDHA